MYIRLFILVFFISLSFVGCIKTEPIELSADEKIASILDLIHEPLIPSTEIRIEPGDSTCNCKQLVQTAVDSISKLGGGTIVVCPGVYFMNGPIHLKSNINLHLEEDAILKFSSNPKDYLPVVKTSWEGTFLYNYSPFVYGYGLENVSITGKGKIDGEASDTWQTWKAIQKEDQLLSREMNHNSVPIEERIFGDGHYLRPHLIQFYDCKNILVEDVGIEDSPFWCVHLLRCENVTVRGVKFNAFNKNNDGIDPEYSRNVLIENIEFNNSDDNVAIKAGRDNEGRASEVRSENIIVRNCKFKGLHAIVIGSEMSAGVENVFVHDCSYAGYLKRGIYIKSNPDRGGFIKNIYFKNIKFGETEDCIFITSFYHGEGEGHVTEIKNIYVENISCKKANNYGITIQGFPEKKVSDIYLSDIVIDSVANPVSMSNVENIVFGNTLIGKQAGSPSYVK